MSISNIEVIKEYSTYVLLLKVLAIVIKENMVTALTTEADKPVKKAKNQRKITNKIVFIIVPCFNFFKGDSKEDKTRSKIPMCKPEIANICITPALV